MFKSLEQINVRPQPFQYYTAEDLWNEEHTSKMMLECHLNSDIDISSRNHEFIDRSADWIAKRFNVKEGTRIVDFGCGPGLYASRLAKLGADVVGVDFSKRSIDYAQNYAKESGLNIEYVCENYLSFKSDKKFDLIIMIFCDFCALSGDQRRELLQVFHSHLADGGQIFFDVFSDAAYKKREEASLYEENLLHGFWSPSKYYGFQNTFKYDDEKVVLDKFTIVEDSRTRLVYNWLKYFTLDELSDHLDECGLKIVESYGNVAGDVFAECEDQFAVVVKKKD